MITVVGIDPGLAATGIGIVKGTGLHVNSYGVDLIKTHKEDLLPERLNQIFVTILQLLKSESPDYLVIEDVFSLKQNPKSGIILGKVSGVILLAGCQAKIKISEIAVREAKQVLTGNGTARKEQLEKAVRVAVKAREPIKPYHKSDALALALIGLYRFGR
jgi:crossover junction endodeoxyribonuclease RuvC